MDYVLGLDGGGTKTSAVILDGTGVERGRGQGGPCNIATCDAAALTVSIRDAMQSALQNAALPPDTRFAGVCSGVAGYTAKRRRADFARLLAEVVPAERHRVEPDFVIAYWGATEGEPGIVVIAGTGAVIYGRNAAGETCRVDGRGFLLGDRGSGFEIGKWALQCALARLEQGENLGDFTRRVMDHLGIEDADDLINWVYTNFQPAKVASLAYAVGVWATEGSEIARNFISAAGHTLRHAVLRTQYQLQMPDSTPVYLMGGLWNIGEILQTAFQQGGSNINNLPPLTNICAPKHDPAYGAALLALPALTAQPPQEV